MSDDSDFSPFEMFYLSGLVLGVTLVIASAIAGAVAGFPALWRYALPILLGNFALGLGHQLWLNRRAGGAPRDSRVVRKLDLDPDEHPGVRDTEVED